MANARDGARRRWRDRVGEFFFPRKCAFCRAPWPEVTPCPSCQAALPWLTGRRACRAVQFIPEIAAPLAYEGAVRHCIHQLKFRHRVAVLPTLALLAGQCARDHFAGRVDLITWVPLSARSLRQRGFDQSYELALGAGEALGLPVTSLFTKSNRARRQSTIREAAARRANVAGAFALALSPSVAGKRVLIVDDLVTSGSTLSECARVLLQEGAEEVYGLCLASTHAVKNGIKSPQSP